MEFHWDEVNVQEIATHGIDRATAEAVFFAEDRAVIPGPHSLNRFTEGGVRIRIKPGRPPKGKEAPIRVKAVKMPVAFWETFESQAEASGLTLHAAMRSALLEWASRHRAS